MTQPRTSAANDGSFRNVLAVICPDYWMKVHIIPALRAFFERVDVLYYPGMAFWGSSDWVDTRQQRMEELVARCRSMREVGGIDAVFMIAYDDYLLPAYAKRLREEGIFLINYNVDMPTQWYRCIRSGRYCSVVGAGSDHHLESLRNYGANVVYCPMASNTTHYCPREREKKFDVVFVGGYTPARADALAACCDVTSSVGVYGLGWDDGEKRGVRSSFRKAIHDARYLIPRLRHEGLGFRRTGDWGSRTYDVRGRTGGAQFQGMADDVPEVFASARVVVGVNQRFGCIGSQDGLVCARLRDFEVPSCGRPYLVQWHPELDRYYPEGEVIAWRSLDELRAKLDDCLTRSEQAEDIGRAARARVVECHQWSHRLRTLCEAASECS